MTSTTLEEAKTYARILAKSVLPASAISRLRAGSQQRRRAVRRKAGCDPATGQRLVDDLRALGIERGRDLLVHSSMSALGPVEGGAATLLAALVEVAGPEATILAPAYPMPGSMLEWMQRPDVFDLRHTRSCMGAFTELLRSQPGAQRSAHPTHSIVALGPHAEEYVSDHHRGQTGTGPLSPFAKHIDRGGQILCLGTGIGKVTSYHVVEDVMPGFPISPYLEKMINKAVVFADGQRREIATRVHDPRLSPWRIDNFMPKEREIHALLRAQGLVSDGRLGAAAASLIDAGALLTAMLDLAYHGITIYHRPLLQRLGLVLGKPLGGRPQGTVPSHNST